MITSVRQTLLYPHHQSSAIVAVSQERERVVLQGLGALVAFIKIGCCQAS